VHYSLAEELELLRRKCDRPYIEAERKEAPLREQMRVRRFEDFLRSVYRDPSIFQGPSISDISGQVSLPLSPSNLTLNLIVCKERWGRGTEAVAGGQGSRQVVVGLLCWRELSFQAKRNAVAQPCPVADSVTVPRLF
jgi:hypothetical protein